ncbi:site-2 protease family protein [Psychrobacillus sp. L3]|uniref:site-2 protease family protein n=1 Tax=Psychrobacillus sp. L3 TaxID=3236891 RepID=UPI0036F3FEF5
MNLLSGYRKQMNKKVFKVHPIMIPFFLFFYLSGEIAVYSILFGSLLFHELGHLFAAKLLGIRVNSCTILPYGGEIKMEQFSKNTNTDQLLVILFGPFFTFLLLIFFSLVDLPQKNIMVFIQFVIFCFNLLPVYPLDGGRALLLFIPDKYVEVIGFSLFSSLFIFCVSLYYFPKALSVTIVFLFLALQNYSYWRFRKYKLAFDYVTKNA